MSASPRVVVLGGGLAGVGAAFALLEAGIERVTVLERGSVLGGLAGSFERDGRSYPLGYHHILDRDRPLLYFLDRIGAFEDIRWRRIRLLLQGPSGDDLFNLANPIDFLRFPLGPIDKIRFVHLMLRAYARKDWEDWEGRSAAELIDAWGGPRVRERMFEPLTRLKFELACDEVSASWVGARLSHREGASPLGYIPDANWTTVLCEGLQRQLGEMGCDVRLDSRVKRLVTEGDRVCAAELFSGEVIEGDQFVSTVPTEVYGNFVPEETTAALEGIEYTALLSAVCSVPEPMDPDFYWLNLTRGDRAACAIFVLSSLNPTLGAPGTSCLNFITHLASRARPLFRLSDDEIVEKYLEDFRVLFGRSIQPSWVQLNRIAVYSPVFHRRYVNPPLSSERWPNVWFAGNFRTFPSVASTGTALASGVETAEALLESVAGPPSDLSARIAAFSPGRLRKA